MTVIRIQSRYGDFAVNPFGAEGVHFPFRGFIYGLGDADCIVYYALRKELQKQQTEKALAGDLWDNHFNLVFTDALGKNLVRRTVVKHFKKIIQLAEISDDARFHDLRHSFAVTSLYAGDDIKTVQTNLGHATAQFTLDTYGHVTQKMRQDSANRM